MARTTSILQLVIEVLDRSRGGFNSFRGRLTNVSRSIFSLQNAMRALVAGGFALGLRSIFEMGASLEELENKFSLTMGASRAEMELFVEGWAEMSGISDRSAKDLLATTALINQGLGLQQHQSAKAAEQAARLAADWASFTEQPTAAVISAINAAMTGENERLKNIGIVLDEVEKSQRAVNEGWVKGTSDVTRLHRAQATLLLIQEKMGVALGDNERTMDSAARRAKTLSAQLENVRDKVAKGMLPALTDMLSLIIDAIGDTDELAEKLKGPMVEGAQLAAGGLRLVLDHLNLIIAAIKVLVGVWIARLVAVGFAAIASGALRVASALETARIAMLLMGDGAGGVQAILSSMGTKLLRSGVIGAGIFAATMLIKGMGDAWDRAGSQAERALDKFFRGGQQAARTPEEAAQQLPGLRSMREEQLRLFQVQAEQVQRATGGIKKNAEAQRERHRQILMQLDEEIRRLEALEQSGIAAMEPLTGGGGSGGGDAEGPLADLRKDLDELQAELRADADGIQVERARLEEEIRQAEMTLEARARARERFAEMERGGGIPAPRLSPEADPELVGPVQAPPVEAFEGLAQFDEALEGIKQSFRDVGSVADDAFANIIAGSILSGQSFAGAMLKAIGQVAAAQGKLFAAEAIAALARGILGDPRGFAAAAKFSAASGLMFGLAGLLGAGAGTGGAGGGAGSAAAAGQDALENAGTVTVIMPSGGLFNPNDPRQVEEFADMIETLTGRRVIVTQGG